MVKTEVSTVGKKYWVLTMRCKEALTSRKLLQKCFIYVGLVVHSENGKDGRTKFNSQS